MVQPSAPIWMAFFPHNNINKSTIPTVPFTQHREDISAGISSFISPFPPPSSYPSFPLNINKSAIPALPFTQHREDISSPLPRPTLLFLSTLQVFTDENSAECSSAGESGAEHQVPRLSLSEVVHIRTISASGDLISLQQEDEKFSKQLEKGKVR